MSIPEAAKQKERSEIVDEKALSAAVINLVNGLKEGREKTKSLEEVYIAFDEYIRTNCPKGSEKTYRDEGFARLLWLSLVVSKIPLKSLVSFDRLVEAYNEKQEEERKQLTNALKEEKDKKDKALEEIKEANKMVTKHIESLLSACKPTDHQAGKKGSLIEDETEKLHSAFSNYVDKKRSQHEEKAWVALLSEASVEKRFGNLLKKKVFKRIDKERRQTVKGIINRTIASIRAKEQMNSAIKALNEAIDVLEVYVKTLPEKDKKVGEELVGKLRNKTKEFSEKPIKDKMDNFEKFQEGVKDLLKNSPLRKNKGYVAIAVIILLALTGVGAVGAALLAATNMVVAGVAGGGVVSGGVVAALGKKGIFAPKPVQKIDGVVGRDLKRACPTA